MPSPTIATWPPRSCSFFTSSAFWDGSTSGITSSMATSCATASAPLRESPTPIVPVSPSFFRCKIASFAVGLIGSEIAMTAYTVLFTTTMTGVRPWAASRSASWPREPSSRLRSRAWRSEITSTQRRSTVPAAPRHRGSSHHRGDLAAPRAGARSGEHTSELQSRLHLVCRLLLDQKKPQLRAAVHSHLHPPEPVHDQFTPVKRVVFVDYP